MAFFMREAGSRSVVLIIFHQPSPLYDRRCQQVLERVETCLLLSLSGAADACRATAGAMANTDFALQRPRYAIRAPLLLSILRIEQFHFTTPLREGEVPHNELRNT